MTDSMIGEEPQTAEDQQADAAATDAAATGNSTPAASDKPAADPAAAQSDAAQAAADSPGAPEKYDFKAPDGQQFDAGVIGAFSDVAKELNLPQDAAQKLVDKMAPVIVARQTEHIESIRNGWAESSKTDKEFGGAKLTENLAVAQKGLDKIGSPELKKLLAESGLGNHPEIIRAFFRAGKAMGEDSFVGGRAAANDGKLSAPSVLYDKTKTA